MLEVITTYTWPYDGLPFVGLHERVERLANRLGIKLSHWKVDGLGPASGFGFRSKSGRVFLLEELEHSIEQKFTNGPWAYADAYQIAKFGLNVLLKDLIETLALAEADKPTLAEESLEKYAATIVEKVDAVRAKLL